MWGVSHHGLAQLPVFLGPSGKSVSYEELTATIFEAASLPKPMYAYFVLKLAASGPLQMDQPLWGIAAPTLRVADVGYPRLSFLFRLETSPLLLISDEINVSATVFSQRIVGVAAVVVFCIPGRICH